MPGRERLSRDALTFPVQGKNAFSLGLIGFLTVSSAVGMPLEQRETRTVASALRAVTYTTETLDGGGPRGRRLNSFLPPRTALRVSNVPASRSCARAAAPLQPLVLPWPRVAAACTLGACRLGGKPFPEIHTSFLVSLWSEQGQMATTNPIWPHRPGSGVTQRGPDRAGICGLGSGGRVVSYVYKSITIGCFLMLRPSMTESAELFSGGKGRAEQKGRILAKITRAPCTEQVATFPRLSLPVCKVGLMTTCGSWRGSNRWQVSGSGSVLSE